MSSKEFHIVSKKDSSEIFGVLRTYSRHRKSISIKRKCVSSWQCRSALKHHGFSIRKLRALDNRICYQIVSKNKLKEYRQTKSSLSRNVCDSVGHYEDYADGRKRFDMDSGTIHLGDWRKILDIWGLALKVVS